MNYESLRLGPLSDTQQQVRAVCWVVDEVLTGSRDSTAKLWSHEGSDLFVCKNTFKGHHRYIMSVAYAPPTAQHPNGLFKLHLHTCTLRHSFHHRPYIRARTHTHTYIYVHIDIIARQWREKKKTERKIEREIQADRQTGRERERERKKQRERNRERIREREKETHTHTHTHTQKEKEREIDR